MADLTSPAARAEEQSASFLVFIDKLEQQVQQSEANALQEAKKFDLTPQAAQAAATKDSRSFRDKLVESTANERETRLARLKEIEQQAIDHEPMLQTSEQVLALKGQGAAELDRYVNQLRDLAPHQLDTFRHQSLVTSDKVLGAALALRVGAMNPKDRPFNVVEFADALVGLEFTANQKAIARIKLATKKAVHADLAFSRGRSNLMSNIAIGIAERELQQ